MTVYSVEMNENDSVSLDWNAVWQTAGSNFGLNLGGLSSLGAQQKVGMNILKGPFARSNFIFGALNSVGKTSLVTRGQVMTMNRQAAPLQVVEETNYLSKVTVTTTDKGVETALEAGNVIAGFSSTVTPKIEEDGEILLQFAGSISELKKIDKFTSGTSQIQLPQKSLRDFLQRVKIRSGETLVMTGFEQKSSNSADSGVGHSKNLLLGGSQSATGKRVSLVVAITPYIID
jgi:type IVB pilus formation R64 PilN family outer membrane protein